MTTYRPTRSVVLNARKGTFVVETNIPDLSLPGEFVSFSFTFHRARKGKPSEVHGYLPFGRFYACGNSMDAAQQRAFALVDEYLNLSSVASDFPAFALVHAGCDENCFWTMRYAYAGTPVVVDYNDDKREWYAEMNGTRAYCPDRADAVRALLEGSREVLEPQRAEVMA